MQTKKLCVAVKMKQESKQAIGKISNKLEINKQASRQSDNCFLLPDCCLPESNEAMLKSNEAKARKKAYKSKHLRNQRSNKQATKKETEQASKLQEFL